MMLARRRVWFELAVGFAGLVLLVLTAAWPTWIEAVIGVDPDGGNGAVEWALLVTFAACAVALPWHARSEWRRAREVEAAGGRVPGA